MKRIVLYESPKEHRFYNRSAVVMESDVPCDVCNTTDRPRIEIDNSDCEYRPLYFCQNCIGVFFSRIEQEHAALLETRKD